MMCRPDDLVFVPGYTPFGGQEGCSGCADGFCIMSDFFQSRAAGPGQQPDPARTILMIALVVAMLYVGREIFIPIAIAIVVSFVLSPPILLLWRWGFGRVPSVLTVVLAGGHRISGQDGI